jgi:two-component system, LuxR family, sensor kinase FixL
MRASAKAVATGAVDRLDPRFLAVSSATFWTTGADGRLELMGDVPRPSPMDAEADGHLALVHPDDRSAVAAASDRARRAGEPFDVECRARFGDAYHWVRLRGRFDARDRRWFGSIEDIQRQRDAKAALHIANERLALALDGNEAWAWDFDLTAGRFWFSDRWQALLGYDADEISYDLSDFRRLVHPDDQPDVDRAFRAHLAGHTASFEADYRIRRKDGGWTWVQDRGHVVERDPAGRPVRAIGIRSDITMRKTTEAQLRASEAHLKALLDTMTDAMIAVGPDVKRGFYNKAYERLFLDPANARMWDDLPQLFALFDIYDADGKLLADDERPIVRILQGETISDLQVTTVVRETGRRHRLIYNGQPLYGPNGDIELAMLSIRDVTEQHATQAALAASEERLRRATEGAGMGAWDYDLTVGTGVWSESACRLLGFPVETYRTWTMADWQSRVHPDDIGRVMANAAVSRAAGQPYVIDFRIVRGDDAETRWVESFGTYVYDAAGNAVRHVGVFFDITDRKLADERLRESEARLEAIIETLEEGVVAYAPGDITGGFTNSAFRRMVAPHDPSWRTFTDVSDGLRAFELIDPDGHALTPEQRPMPRLLRGERIEHLPARVRFRDGRELDVVCRGEPIFDSEGRVRLAILAVRDVTRQLQAEADLATLQQELIHVSRVSAMGTMAGSLAHELNQPLAAIANYAAAARMMLGRPETPLDRPREALSRVASEAVRAGDIVNRLRRFITKGEVDRKPESLADIVREALAIAHSDSAARGTHVKLKLDPDADGVVADRVQLQQVIFNLVRNAVEAMTGVAGGELTIASRPAADDATCVELLIADRGPGLAPDVAASLFEPFITTKEGGMGIGLPICRSIMRAHDGDIRAEKRPRGGTVFILTLPRATPAPDGLAAGTTTG